MNIAVVPTSSTLAVQARQYAGPDLERRDLFVLDCPDATFFHRIGWCEIFESVFHNRTHYLLAERGVEIVGVLPLVQLKGLLFGHSQQSLPFAVYGGPATLDADARTALQRMAVELGCELGVEYLELPNRSPGEPPWHGCNQDATFCKNLLPKVEANMLASPRKRRTLVRKVIQRELRSEIDSSTDRFFELYAGNQHRYEIFV